jgi:hypothetical protein
VSHDGSISGPDQNRRDILTALTRAGVDASVLDPAGKRSAAEMTAYVEDMYRRDNVSRARFELSCLQDGVLVGNIDENLKTIREELKKGGVTAAALDRDGRRSSAEMEAVLQKAAQAARVEEYKLWDGHVPDVLKAPSSPPTGLEQDKKQAEKTVVPQGNTEIAPESITHGLDLRHINPGSIAKRDLGR